MSMFAAASSRVAVAPSALVARLRSLMETMPIFTAS